MKLYKSESALYSSDSSIVSSDSSKDAFCREDSGRKKSTRSVGDAGENKTVDYLQSLNYSIITRNFRTRTGEIDIIALKDDVLVFVEVKTLPSGDLETLSHELNERKQKRIIETAKFFLLKHRKYSNSNIRFDVAVVDMPGLDSVYYIQNAFSEFV